jgi:hypothetical protein
MDFTVYNPVRVWLYRRRHPLWFDYVEPVLGVAAAGLMLLGLFLIEAVAILGTATLFFYLEAVAHAAA